MVSRSASLRKFIRVVLDQLPQYIERYSKNDQIILREFFTLLQKCESLADIARSSLSEELDKYSQDLKRSEIYFSNPFLWFIAEYFVNAHLLLSVSGFHAEDYYAYLVKHLRTNSDLKGAFQLIRDRVPLDDSHWEELQYACIEPPHLSQVDIESLIAVTLQIEGEGLQSLNPSRTRAVINNLISRNNPKQIRRLNRFFNPLLANWNLWFFHPAFGIDEFILRIKLTGFRSFNQIFDYIDPDNYTLCMSEIYRVRNSNTYIGTVFIPDHLQGDFLQYLRNLEEHGDIIIEEFMRITDLKYSSSLNLYKAGEGWREINNTEWTQIIRYLNNDNLEKGEFSIPYFSLSSQFNTKWNFRKHTNAAHAIRVYCNFPRIFNYDSLPFKVQPTTPLIFSKREKAHLKEMYNNHVVQVIFQVHRLYLSFSLNRYWIKIPQMPLKRLNLFLSYLPDCNLFLSDNHIYLLTRLTEKSVLRIERDLQWEVLPSIQINYLLSRMLNWFDLEISQWKSPKVLIEKRGKV